MIHLLERAGYFHVAEFKTFYDDLPSDLLLSVVLPPENAPIDTFKEASRWAFADKEVAERFPGVSISMHAWYDTPLLSYGWDEFDRRIKHLETYHDVWRCNHNQYAAYRWQFLHGSAEVIERKGHTVRVRVQRPPLTFLNDPTPVTLGITGVAPESIAGAACDTAGIRPAARNPGGIAMFNIGHDRTQQMPQRIGWVANEVNRLALRKNDQNSDFPGLQALLSYRDGAIRLELHNGTDQALHELLVQYRLPLQFEEGIRRIQAPRVESGITWRDAFTPAVADLDAKYFAGDVYLMAQLDFVLGDEPGRLYATCSVPGQESDSFPKGRFARLGPIPEEAFNLDGLHEMVEAGGIPATWTLPDGKVLAWRAQPDDGNIEQSFLDVELIRTQGNWFANSSPVYLLRSTVTSPQEQPVSLLCYREDIPAVFLNGSLLDDFKGILRQGDNDLMLVHRPQRPQKPCRNSACFLRLTQSASGDRLTDISYAIPEGTPPAQGGKLRIALLQILPEGSDQKANLDIAEAWCRKAARAGADIALLPEMFNIGYTGFNGTDAETVQQWQAWAVDPASSWVQHFGMLARELDMAIAATCLLAHKPAPLNALMLFDRHGQPALTYGKVHTCDFAFEAACSPGEGFHAATIDTHRGPVRVGAMICFDREFPESARLLMLEGAEIILTPNACPLDDVRLNQFQARAYENSLAVFMTNYPAPHQNGRSVAYGPDGRQLALAGPDEEMVMAEVDLDALRGYRRTSIWGDAYRRPQRYGPLIEPSPLPVFERTTIFGQPVNRTE